MSVQGKFSRFILLIAAIITAFLPFAAPQACGGALQDGLVLCGGTLLLSLFPFLMVSSLLISCGVGWVLAIPLRPIAYFIGLRSRCAAEVLLIGMLGGFAPAAKSVAEGIRRGRIKPDEAAALLPACICSGPSFVILTVGGHMLGSVTLGVCLFCAQLFAGWLTAALLSHITDINRAGSEAAMPAEPTPLAIPRLDTIIADCALAYIKLCGFVIYFRMLASGLGALLPQKFVVPLTVLLEISSGCDLASQTGFWASTLCCAALSLQGVSVLMQVRTICPAEVSFKPLLAARLLHLPLSIALFHILLPKGTANVFCALADNMITMRRVPLDCAILVFFACCIAVCEMSKAAQRIKPGN